jgi:hypothetical protein
MPEPARPIEAERGVSDRSLVVVSALVATTTLLVVFWPAFLGRVFVYGDLGMFHLPLRRFYAETLAAGRPGLWLPNLFCGFDLHGEGQVGMYHPVHWALYALLPLSAAFNLECALGYPLTLAGTAVFLRRLGLPAPAAAFGGLVFGFCGFLMVRLTHVNIVAVLAHLPWLLWATDVALREADAARRDRALAGIALLRGSQLLLGYPGAVYLSLLCEGLYALPVAVVERNARRLLWLAGASLVGVGIGAVQLVPTIEHLAASVRADTSFEYRTAQSLHPANVLQLLAPYLFRDRGLQVEIPNPIEQAFYLGAVVPVAATWLVVRRRQLGRMRPLLLGALGGTLLGVGLGLGRYSPLFRMVVDLPVVGVLRGPARYTLLVFLGGAIVAAVAYADLLGVVASRDPASRRQAWRTWWSVLPGTVVALGALGLRRLAPATGLESLRPASDILLGPLLSLVAAGLWFAAARGRRLALPALVVFAAVDQAAYGASLWWSQPPVTVSGFVAGIPTPPVDPAHRLLDHSTVLVNRNERGQVVFRATTPLIVHGTRLVHGYAGLMPRRRLDYRSPAALRVAGVTARLVDNGYAPLPGGLERFRLVSRVVVSDAPASAIGTIDVATTAVVDVPLDPVPGPPGTVVVREDVAGRMALVTESTTRQLLVVSESHHPGWRLTVDGAEAPLLRAYGDFMGALVEAGRHEIALRFEPAGLRIGRWLSAAAVSLLVVFALWRLPGRRRAAHAPGPTDLGPTAPAR